MHSLEMTLYNVFSKLTTNRNFLFYDLFVALPTFLPIRRDGKGLDEEKN